MIAPALATRARGLSAGLLDGEIAAAIDGADNLPRLAATLARAGYGEPETLDSADAIDRACARRAAADLGVLWRWAGAGDGALEVAAGDQDRRNLTALVRGLVARTSSERRRAVLVATPSMPEALLGELVAAPSAAAIARRLARADHPLAAPLAAHAGEPIDLAALELALARTHAARARAAIGGSEALAAHVSRVIDADNLGAALALAKRGAPDTRDLERHFIEGGARLARRRFVAAAGATAAGAIAILAPVFARTPLGPALGSSDPGALEEAALEWQLEAQAARRRRRPLGAAPVLWLIARRRADCRRIGRAAWALALGGRR